MKAGRLHDLVPISDAERTDTDALYRCRACGEAYQVRTSAPGCRIRYLEQLERLCTPYAPIERASQRVLLDELVRRRLRWRRVFRKVMLDHFDRWQQWKSGFDATDAR